VEDNFNLKQIIDTQKVEMEKLRKKSEVTRDQLTNKEMELKQVSEDLNNFKKKNKMESKQNNGVNEDLKSGLMQQQNSNNLMRE
jgi:hypothetical protein